MGTMKYKGYMGSVDYNDDDNCLHGKVLGLPSNILITYEGDSIINLRDDFMTAVDDYIDECEKQGVLPQKTYSGSFNIRISPELHGKVAEHAALLGETINSFVKSVLEIAVDGDGYSVPHLADPAAGYNKK